MNTPIRRHLAASLAATLTATVAGQSPAAYGSFDPASPECGMQSAAAAVELAPGLHTFVQAGRLGIPGGGNVDAFSTGHELFDAAGPGQRRGAARFSVARGSRGAAAAIRDQVLGNGAASDLFLVDLGAHAGQPVLDRDAPGLTPGASDLDALLGALPQTARYPLFFSVDPRTAAVLGCDPADILWLQSPGAHPGPFVQARDLGLLPGDDIDALSAGPAGFVFSLTARSPSALLFPDLGGAGLFCNGPFPWAMPAQLGLLPDDELDALQCFDPSQLGLPTLSHTPMWPGRPCILRVTDLLAGAAPWALCTFRDPQTISIPGLTLDILPDFVLGVLPPADPLGFTQMTLPIPPDAGGLSLAMQAVVPPAPQFGAGWQVTNPVQSDIRIAWRSTRLTLGAAANGYSVTAPRGVDVLNFHGVRPAGGGPLLNGPQHVMVVATVNGRRVTWYPTVDFVNGNATWGLPVPVGATVRIQSVFVYPWV